MAPHAFAERNARSQIDAAPARPASRATGVFGAFAVVAMAVLFVAGKPLAPPASCRVAPGSLVFGLDTHATLATSAGVPCAFTLRVAATSIESVELLAAPSDGTATLNARNVIHYRPNAAFRGEDSFDIAIRGGSTASDGVSVVRVGITVD